MSNRTLIELNHDYCPDDGELLAWARSFQFYMRTGDKNCLPCGVTFKQMRHRSEPEVPNLPVCANCSRECEHEAEIYAVCPNCGGRTWTFYTYAITAPVAVQPQWNYDQSGFKRDPKQAVKHDG